MIDFSTPKEWWETGQNSNNDKLTGYCFDEADERKTEDVSRRAISSI